MNQLVTYETSSGRVELSPQIVKQYLVNGQGNVTDQEVNMFLKLCQYQKLNPFLREAYLIKYSDNGPASIVVGKETFTKRAEANELYDGMEAGVVVFDLNTNEVTHRQGTLVLPGEQLAGGWAKVYRKDWTHPIESSVNLSEFIQVKNDGKPNKIWSKMPGTMIRKVAVMQALREAFPQDLGGMYGAEEMPVDSSTLPTASININPIATTGSETTINVTADMVETTEPEMIMAHYCEGSPCEGKSKIITTKIAEFSKSKFGKKLCFSCQALAKSGETV
ncbi:MAG TPA: phage recombination protein Bet [Desulfosporosinus sp.]|nr:phage recombination protein Bet [Desulfosporosinus sp.]